MVTTAEYRLGVSGDHRAGRFKFEDATKGPQERAAIVCAADAAVATVFLAASRISHVMRHTRLWSLAFSTTVPRLSEALSPLTSQRM